MSAFHNSISGVQFDSEWMDINSILQEILTPRGNRMFAVAYQITPHESFYFSLNIEINEIDLLS